MSAVLQILFAVLALLFCLIPHEVAHGIVALWLGDPTAKRAGRLSLNPLRHLDPIGSVVLPLALILIRHLTGAPVVVFGWAKPVPINPYYFRDPWRGMVWVGLAGPTTNVLLGALAMGLARLFFALGARSSWIFTFLALYGLISLLIAFFNLIPLPPLDGSRVLAYFLPNRWRTELLRLEQFGIIVVVVLLVLGVLDVVLRAAEAVAVYMLGPDIARLSGLWW